MKSTEHGWGVCSLHKLCCAACLLNEHCLSQASDTESHDSEYDEESDGQEAGEQQQRESVPRGPVTWQCPVEGCNKKNLVEGKNGKLPNLRMDKNGEIQKIFDAWW